MLPELPKGKSVIQYYLTGEADGVMTMELSNWSGMGFRIPRSRLTSTAGLEFLNTPGFYILIGVDEKDLPTAYIGKSEAVRGRLVNHAQNKDFWTEAIAFVSKDDHLNAGNIGWLEANAFRMALDAKHYKLDNSSVPGEPKLSLALRDASIEFLHNAAFLLQSIGQKILVSPAARMGSAVANSSESELQLMLRDRSRGIDATASEVDNRYIVHEGSRINSERVPSTPKSAIKLFEELREGGLITQIEGDVHELNEPVEFTSPSGAGVFVTFRSTNGRDAWKLADGRSLKEHQLGQIAAEKEADLFSELESDSLDA